MADLSSPRASRLPVARWLDVRLLAGVLLVLSSVLLGAKVLASADDAEQVWAASRDLDAGTTLSADDVQVVGVQLEGAAGHYLGASGPPPEGYRLMRPVAAGELVPAAAVVAPDRLAERRLVTVPVERHHYPADLGHGDRVDVYRTASGEAGRSAEPELVVAGANVAGVDAATGRLGGGSAEVGVVLEVEPETVAALVGAVRSGSIDLVRVPRDQP